MQRAVAALCALGLFAALPAAAQSDDPFRSAAPPAPAASPAPVTVHRPRSAVEDVAPATPDAEIIFWQSIANSGNAADFEEYLRQYPSGQFAGLARNRIAALRAPAATPAAITPPTSSAMGVDGVYVGTVEALPEGNGSSRQGGAIASVRQIEACNPGNYDNRIEIRNGQFSFMYNRATAKTMTGKVSGDSSLDGLGATDFGGVRLTARIQSGEVIGNLISADCRYELHLRRQ